MLRFARNDEGGEIAGQARNDEKKCNDEKMQWWWIMGRAADLAARFAFVFILL